VVVNEVARVYAGALLEIGKEQNILDQVAEELKFKIGRASCRERVY
jgi:F0F1-type ATP synthase delta subunit